MSASKVCKYVFLFDISFWVDNIFWCSGILLEVEGIHFLGGLCFPVLAVLFGFSALLYNRSRALQSSAAQRRSLYAAERALQATILFVLGVGSAAIIATIISVLGLDITNTPQSPRLLLLFFIPIMLVVFSFGAFYLALRAISHGMVRSIGLRPFMKRIR